VTLILKKRLFSSPAAFAITLESHLTSENEQRSRGTDRDDVPDWLTDALEWDAEPADDEPGSDDERTAFGRAAAFGP